MALTAGLAGAIMLAPWFGEYSAATQWTVLRRSQLIAKGKQFAGFFGLNVNDSKAYVVATLSKPLTQYPKGVSPLSVRITYVSKQGGRPAEVGFDSSGRLNYWRAPKGDKPSVTSGPSRESAARAAFRTMAGAEASAYVGPKQSMGDDIEDEDYIWTKPAPPHSSLKESIKVVTKGVVVTSIERRLSALSGEDEDSSFGDNTDYWDVLGISFGIVCTAGFIGILSIYVLWLARRAISHQLPLRLAAAALLLMSAVMLFGADWEKSHSLSKHEDLPIVSTLFAAGVILCFATVGRGISASARPKWMSLEQLCLLAPLSKSAGLSIAAGLLFSPLLVAVPFVIAACGLFPHAWVLPQTVELLYSRMPLLDSLHLETYIYLLGFFGCGLPALERLVRLRWLRWCIVLPVGTVFFADLTRVVSGPIAAPLTAGLLTLALFWYVWAHFDVLAVLTLELARCLLLTGLTLGQKGAGGWSTLAAVGCLAVLAFWFYQRGQAVSEGDSRATIPALTGFRAEREKLQAEFSVARRAQQDMLPPTPEIAGYSIAASCTPSLEVGGDLYDFLKLPDGRIGIGVADVSGKGVPAALYMTLTKGLLASVTRDSSQLRSVVEEVNRHLHSVTRKKVFVTMALGFLDVEKRTLECVRAGHTPLVWRQPAQDVTTLVSPGGLGLGITAGRVFGAQLKVADLMLSAGDAVVFYSDGITEAMNSQMELFGEERLVDAVRKTDRMAAGEARDSILNEVQQFLGGIHPQDDMTVVVLRVGASEQLGHDSKEVRGSLVRG